MTEQEVIDGIDFKFYAVTDGCYLFSDGINMAVCHRCDKDNPMTINPDGEDFYVRFVKGELAPFMQLIDGIRYIVFERMHDDGNFRIYEFDRFKRRVSSSV